MMSLRAVASCALAAALGACGGPTDAADDDDDPVDPPTSISVSVTPANIRVPIGGTATADVTITRVGVVTEVVGLMMPDCPPSLTHVFAPPSLATGQSASTLTFTASLLAPASTGVITVNAAAGTLFASKVVPFEIYALPGFTLVPALPTVDVVKGQSVQVTLAVTRAGGFAGPVTLALEGATGVTGTFAPNPVTGAQGVLTLTAGAAAPPGPQALTIRATAEGLEARTATITVMVFDPAAPGFTLSVDPPSLTADAGTVATAVVKVRRTGGFTGVVTFAIVGLTGPIGARVLQVGYPDSTGIMTLDIGIEAAAGTFTFEIVGVAAGLENRRIPYQLTIRTVPGFSVRVSTPALTTTPNGPAQSVGVSLTRIGGYAGEVSFAATGLPAGVTGTFEPAATTGTASSLRIQAGASAQPVTSTVTVRATAAGMPDRTATFSLTVAADGVPITWRFCDPVRPPLFFAFADGLSQLVVIAAAGDGTYTTRVGAGKGTVIFVVPGLPVVQALDEALSLVQPGRLRWRAAGTQGQTVYELQGTTAELQLLAAAQCPAPVSRKSVTAAVAGVGAEHAFVVALGDTARLAMPGEPTGFTLAGVPAGTHDLVAARARIEGEGGIPDRLIVRRDQDPPAGSAIPLLDFAAAEAVAPDSAALALSLAGLPASARAETVFWLATANGTSALLGIRDSMQTGTHRFYGLPAPQLRAGDLHAVVSSVELGPPEKEFTSVRYTRQVVARDLAFPLDPPPPNVYRFSVTPLVRMEAGVQLGQYGSPLTGETVEAVFFQEPGQRATVLYQTRGWRGTTTGNVILRTPDLRALAGWNEATWGIQPTSPVQWSVETRSAGLGFVPTDGGAFHLARWTATVW